MCSSDLSLTLEYLWREQNPGDERVQAFMAGGDVALVHSIEGFEDFPEYGAKHLMQMGFTDNDLLICTTEGGETPYVIGAAEKAAEISRYKPYFLYCNPDEVLVNTVERSRRVIENPKIEKINLCVGPIALAGSTRMQASTVLQLAVGLAVLSENESTLSETMEQTKRAIGQANVEYLCDFIKKESDLYLRGENVLYQAHDYAITVFTDTTERAPTFSLMPFENELSNRTPSLSYIVLPTARDRNEAWHRLLNRSPRPLDWSGVNAMTSPSYLSSFDFGQSGIPARQRRLKDRMQVPFRIKKESGGIQLELDDIKAELPLSLGWAPLTEHLLLKTHLNIHSTLVMGRMGRYINNLMTWVYPNNGKLIDRAVRYVLYLLHDDGYDGISYEEATYQLFSELESLGEGEALVPKAVAQLKMMV